MDVCNAGGMGVHNTGQEPQHHSWGPGRAEVMVASQPGSVAWAGGRAEPDNSLLPKMGPLLHRPPPPSGHNPSPGPWGLPKGQHGAGDGGQGGVAPWSEKELSCVGNSVQRRCSTGGRGSAWCEADTAVVRG